MNSCPATIWLAGIAAAIAVVVIWVVWDRGHWREFNCEDGPRRTIDTREFATRYSAHSLELEATFKDSAKVGTKVAPVQLQQLSEALQNSQEFRKYVVNGYNSCAITKAQYAEYGTKFQALDSLAREINQLAGSPSLSPEQSKNLSTLIVQYADLARTASSQPVQQSITTVQKTTPAQQQTNQQPQQTSTGEGSPNVQGVQGPVTITVDQSKGKTETKKPAEKKPPEKNTE